MPPKTQESFEEVRNRRIQQVALLNANAGDTGLSWTVGDNNEIVWNGTETSILLYNLIDIYESLKEQQQSGSFESLFFPKQFVKLEDVVGSFKHGGLHHHITIDIMDHLGNLTNAFQEFNVLVIPQLIQKTSQKLTNAIKLLHDMKKKEQEQQNKNENDE